MNMKKMFLALFIGLSTARPITHSLAAELSTEKPLFFRYDSVETFYIANTTVFDYLNRSGIDVRGILTKEEYQNALSDDKKHEDGIVVTKHTKNGDIYFDVNPNNTAMMKVWEHGGKDNRVILKILAQL